MAQMASSEMAHDIRTHCEVSGACCKLDAQRALVTHIGWNESIVKAKSHLMPTLALMKLYYYGCLDT